MVKNKLVGWLFLLVAVFTVYKLAYHPAWYRHLVVDIVGQYINHAHHFLKYKNLANLGYNEYQPGAVMFFAALSPSLLIKDSYESLLQALIWVNIGLIFSSAFIYQKLSGVKPLLIFGFILLACGPIALFRFDLLVGFLVLLTIYFWQKQKSFLSLFILGVATLIKVYPALILPYLLILTLKKSGLKKTSFCFLIFLSGIGLGLIVYMGIFRAPHSEIYESLAIHSRKPVHVESVWATALTILPKFSTGKFASGSGNWGIFGISPKFTLLPLVFYNYFWLLPYAILLLFVWLKTTKTSKLSVYICTTIILLFLIFSKILTPQYLLWFALIIPLINFPNKFSEITNWLILLFILLLSQYVYPLNYSWLLDVFYSTGRDELIFWILAIRNLLLVILFIKFVKNLKWHLI